MSMPVDAESSALVRVRVPRFVQLHRLDDQALRDELVRGLKAPDATLSPKFLYDSLGSRLFDAITELDEYYPTRVEASIFRHQSRAMAEVLGTGSTLVDLGAGNCAKAGRLFDVLKPRRYVAVDISVQFLQQSLACLQREYPAMDMLGVGCDFSARLQLPPEAGEGPRVVFYPGSSIGNFTPEQALAFLRQARQAANGGALLIGVDLVKPADILVPAYDDALGVTAAFNLNLLRHVNRLLGSDFQVGQWRHVALFNPVHSRIEMHLEARRSLCVAWPGGERRFEAGERLHTENSYKYAAADFEDLLRGAGFASTRCWQDERGWFGVWAAACD
jgi:dimethylhistidine N-methyltransferase